MLACAGAASAQNVDILTINPDARTMAMGDASTAASADAFAAETNSAAALFDYNPFQAGFTYSPVNTLVKGHDRYALAGYYTIRNRHAVTFGVNLYNQPKLGAVSGDRTFFPNDENGNYRSFDSDKCSFDVSATVGYGYRIFDWLGASVNVRYLHSVVIGKAYDGLSFDVALYSRFALDAMMDGAWISAALRLSNAGLVFGDNTPDMPMTMRGGVALNLPFTDAHALQIAVDGGYRISPVTTAAGMASLGAEYTLMQLLSVRAGYHWSSQNPSERYGSVGLGVRFMHISIDGMYLISGKDSPWHNRWMIGAGVYF